MSENHTPPGARPSVAVEMNNMRRDEHVHLDVGRDDVPSEASSQQWQVCGATTSRAAIVYVGQLAVGLLVILFCMVHLWWRPKDNTAVYMSTLTGTMGLLLPSPSLERRR